MHTSSELYRDQMTPQLTDATIAIANFERDALERDVLEQSRRETATKVPTKAKTATAARVEATTNTPVEQHPVGGSSMSRGGAMPGGSQMGHWNTAMPNPDSTRPETMTVASRTADKRQSRASLKARKTRQGRPS